MALRPEFFTTAELYECDALMARQGPSRTHWFGFDTQGCDLWSQVVYGARASLTVGAVATGIAAVLAAAGGLLAGYAGGLVDAVVARLTDAWLALPLVLGGAAALALFEERGVRHVALVLGFLGWPILLRLVRSAAMVTAGTDYVAAARALGAGTRRILVRHVLPNALTPFIAHLPIAFGTVVAAEAALSFLGIGLQLPAASWGLLLAEPGERFLGDWHLTVFPSLVLAATVGSLLAIGDALGDASATWRT